MNITDSLDARVIVVPVGGCSVVELTAPTSPPTRLADMLVTGGKGVVVELITSS